MPKSRSCYRRCAWYASPPAPASLRARRCRAAGIEGERTQQVRRRLFGFSALEPELMPEPEPTPEPRLKEPADEVPYSSATGAQAHCATAFRCGGRCHRSQRQMVGPFIFFDQMGPAEFLLGAGMDVRPHPHIGLSTVTYLSTARLFIEIPLGRCCRSGRASLTG